MNNLNKIIEKICPLVFIIITFVYCFIRIPFFDESWAYLISRFNLGEIFYLTRIEGHNILFYLILKLVSGNINLYPYSMLLLNWIISSILIIFFFKYSPFNNLIKFLIVFSYPFLHYFGVIARPYTSGVLVLFLLAHFYKDRLKKPVFYSFLIVLGANISVITTFGAFAFFVLFIASIIKEKNISKKNLILICLIFLSGAIFILSQFISVVFLNFDEYHNRAGLHLGIEILKYTLMPFVSAKNSDIAKFLSCTVSSITFYTFSFVFFKKAKSSFVFCLITFSLMTFLFFRIYIGYIWHYYFYFVYFIIALWLNWDKIKKIKFINIILCCFLFFTLFKNGFIKDYSKNVFDTHTYKTMYDVIVENREFENSKLYYLDYYDRFFPGLGPYFEKQGIKIYDIKGLDRTSFESVKNIQSYRKTPFYGGDFIKHLDKTRNNYIITQGEMYVQGFRAKEVIFNQKGLIYTDDKCKIFFETVVSMPNISLVIYKVNILEVYE